jgi:hypothetical protein
MQWEKGRRQVDTVPMDANTANRCKNMDQFRSTIAFTIEPFTSFIIHPFIGFMSNTTESTMPYVNCYTMQQIRGEKETLPSLILMDRNVRTTKNPARVAK